MEIDRSVPACAALQMRNVNQAVIKTFAISSLCEENKQHGSVFNEYRHCPRAPPLTCTTPLMSGWASEPSRV